MKDVCVINFTRNVDWFCTMILMYFQDVRKAAYIFVCSFENTAICITHCPHTFRHNLALWLAQDVRLTP